MSARDEIMARIGMALGDRAPGRPVPRDYHRAGMTAAADLVELFERRVLDYHATVRRCEAGELPATIARACAENGATRVVVPDGLPGTWLTNAVHDDPRLGTDELDRLDGVLTACAVAIAETGTIVLDHGPGQGRRALTLVPDYHLVVVRTGQIVRSVPDAVAALDARRPMTWISGPSATSDIELSRVEGVHGPRRLDVVITTESP
jgi:L-lactate dehydrogenase complex protein LldG